jgi:glycosyltransferase involved in cell wall biosynthesis
METFEDLIQIVIPCFNGEEFLMETLISIKNQTYRNFDCLMINDCSDDNSDEIFQGFANIDSRFRVLHNSQNKGESYSVNRGWLNRRGRLICILSCDDPQPNDWLEEMYNFYTCNSGIGFIVYYPNRIVVDQNGKFVRQEILLDWSESHLIDDLLCVPSVGALIDTSLLPEDFLPRVEKVEFPSDLIQYLKIAEFGSGLRHPAFFCVWREHKGGKSADKKLRLSKNFVSGMSLYLKTQETGFKMAIETPVLAHTIGILGKEFPLPKAIAVGIRVYLSEFSILNLNPYELLRISVRYIRRRWNRGKQQF